MLNAMPFAKVKRMKEEVIYLISLIGCDVKAELNDSNAYTPLKKRKQQDSRASSPTVHYDESRSPSSVTSSEANLIAYTGYPPKPNHVEMLQYIFPFHTQKTLKMTLEESNDNILQAVLRISQDLLSFRVPFSEGDSLGRVRNIAMLFSSSVEQSSAGRPDCCTSPYCPKQMAFDWAQRRARATRMSYQMPEMIDSKNFETGYRSMNTSPIYSPEKRVRYETEYPPRMSVANDY